MIVQEKLQWSFFGLSSLCCLDNEAPGQKTSTKPSLNPARSCAGHALENNLVVTHFRVPEILGLNFTQNSCDYLNYPPSAILYPGKQSNQVAPFSDLKKEQIRKELTSRAYYNFDNLKDGMTKALRGILKGVTKSTVTNFSQSHKSTLWP